MTTGMPRGDASPSTDPGGSPSTDPGGSPSTDAGGSPGPRRPGDSIARSSALMASGSLVSRVLGLVRTSLILALFGAFSAAGDAWQVANTLPTTVYMLLAAGVINAVFVPQLTKAADRADGGRAFVDRLITLALLALGATTVVALPLAPVLVRLFASTSWDGPTFDLAVRFAWVVLPAIFFYGLYAVLGQVLNAQNRFGAYGWAPALCNVVWLIGLGLFFLVHPGRGHEVADWTASMVLLLGGSLTVGVAAQATILLVPLWRSGWRYRPRFGFRGFGLGSAGRVALWTFAGIAVQQGSLAVASQVLTSADGRGVGRLGYDSVFFLFMTPHGLITVSLATALFTAMSAAAARRDLAAVRAQLRRGLRMVGVTTIPTTVAGLCLATAGMAVVFPGRPLTETRALADVFLVLILALLPYGVLFLVQRAFYAFEDGRTPFHLTLVAGALFAAGAVAATAVLAPQHRALGVAGAAALSDVVAAAVGLRWAAARLGGMRMRDVWEAWTKALFAALLAGLATLLVVGLLQLAVPGRLGAAVSLLLGGAVFVAGYLAAARALRISDVAQLVDPVRRRLPGRPAAAAGDRT